MLSPKRELDLAVPGSAQKMNTIIAMLATVNATRELLIGALNHAFHGASGKSVQWALRSTG